MLLRAKGALIALSAVSALAMLYVGAYQVRAVEHMSCPLLGHGCEAVANAPFARPFGIPDGFLAGGMYALLIVLALFNSRNPWIRHSIRSVALLASAANGLGVVDMPPFRSYCSSSLPTT